MAMLLAFTLRLFMRTLNVFLDTTRKSSAPTRPAQQRFGAPHPATKRFGGGESRAYERTSATDGVVQSTVHHRQQDSVTQHDNELFDSNVQTQVSELANLAPVTVIPDSQQQNPLYTGPTCSVTLRQQQGFAYTPTCEWETHGTGTFHLHIDDLPHSDFIIVDTGSTIYLEDNSVKDFCCLFKCMAYLYDLQPLGLLQELQTLVSTVTTLGSETLDAKVPASLALCGRGSS